jgi:hypothetical protein
MKNFFEKTKHQNITFFLSNSNLCKPCLQRIVLQNCFIQYRFAFSKLWLSEFLNYYFINYYFTILERIDFKPYFYYFMQAKPFGPINNFY